MKKKLQMEIKQIGNQLISFKDNFNSTELKKIVANLHEKLVVLEYIESQLDDPKDFMKSESLDSKSFREENWFTEPEPVPLREDREALIEPLMEKIKDIVAQMPQEARKVDEMLDEVLPERKKVKNDLEDFASNYQETPTFERKEADKSTELSASSKSNTKTESQKPKSLNDKLNQGLQIGLNDRMAFIKHLFDGKTDDYSRVLSQINGMSSFTQAETFIQNTVKPDYKNWKDKDDYTERFMSMVEKCFH
jgi:hypothetical protein